MKKVLSFDLDGTLVTSSFVDAVWLERIPYLYSKTYNISFIEAKRQVEEAYFSIGPEAIEWYDIHYWIKRFNLDSDWKDILTTCLDHLSTYPEVAKALEDLKRQYKLVIISNAADEFIETEMEHLSIGHYFSNIYSAVSTFGKTKKDVTVYKKVCNHLKIESSDIIHVGDNYEFDYITPKKAGISAYYLDRSCKSDYAPYVINDLIEFTQKLAH